MNTVYKTYYDVAKLTIWADGEGLNDANAKRPRMILSFRDGNPRITVYTGETGPNGVISFPMDPYTFGGFIESVKDIIKAEPGTKVTIDSIGSVWENNKPTDKQRVVAVIHIGKTKDGIIYFSVIDEMKPKIVFPLKVSKWHTFRDTNKEVLPEARSSELLARGLVTTLGLIMAQVVVNYTNQEYAFGDRKPGPIKGFENIGTGSSSQGKPKKELTEIDSEISAMLEDLDL